MSKTAFNKSDVWRNINEVTNNAHDVRGLIEVRPKTPIASTCYALRYCAAALFYGLKA